MAVHETETIGPGPHHRPYFAMDAASLMDHGSKLWRAQQLEELQSRKKTVEAAAASGMSPTEQLRAYLSQHYVRVMDLLRSWDEDGNGAISLGELRRALIALDVQMDELSATAVKEFFYEMDADGSVRGLPPSTGPPALCTARAPSGTGCGTERSVSNLAGLCRLPGVE